MDSKHFFVVRLDVEGHIQDYNKLFAFNSNLKVGEDLKLAIGEGTQAEFSEMLDSILTSPKDSRNLLLNLKNSKGISETPIWWEFSVITNSDMDLIGLIGIGVGLKFLEQKMPWSNLVDVLSFSKIQLTEDLKIDSMDSKVMSWIGEEGKKLIGDSIFDNGFLDFSKTDASAILKLEENDEPLCLRIGAMNNLFREFALIILKNKNGYLILLAPTKSNNMAQSIEKPISQAHLAAFTGPIWVLGPERIIHQQNHLAGRMKLVWENSNFVEGDFFSLPVDSGRNNRIARILEMALKGSAGQIDIRINNLNGSPGFWRFLANPYSDAKGIAKYVILQAIDISSLYTRLQQLESESEALKELAFRPSHILRSPLSSMMGLLDLIDQRKLDEENKKYFSYLKPLAKELDDVIRSNAKKISVLD
ncbi:hypothetical protein [Algoriphagus sp. CAU 1675]|uniref:hypothetical protein n=1 Tax=Algoriphagus sp. CAU 1675 TaxID=3032597 RepID=UPI0023DB3BFC|nr:hypothetical protein [Algoriphagus sp. CAU 1675]